MLPVSNDVCSKSGIQDLKVVISLSRNILTIKKTKDLLRLFDAPNCSHFIYSPYLKSVILVVNGQRNRNVSCKTFMLYKCTDLKEDLYNPRTLIKEIILLQMYRYLMINMESDISHHYTESIQFHLERHLFQFPLSHGNSQILKQDIVSRMRGTTHLKGRLVRRARCK